MIDTQAIRSKILDLAMRGQLTGQLPEDGTAEELYQQIQAEKQRLISEGKIKKEKPLPEISEKEIPFDIPDNWKWVRIVSAFRIEMGQSPKGASVSSADNGIEFHQGKVFFGAKYLNDSGQRTTMPTKIAGAGSVLLCVRAPVGKVNITERKICIVRGLCAITPIFNTELDYLYYYLIICEKTFIDQSTGSTFAAIGGNIIKKQLIPLPPFAEQKRIVEKIEQSFKALDIIDELQAQYADNLTALKSKLIDAAIQGKLTEQLPEDGTAEELYTQIQAEKQRLISEGKIKKEKPLPEISEEEIPFDIPANWKWVRIGQVFNLQSGKNITSSNIYDNNSNNHPYLCYGGNGIRGYVEQYNRDGHYALIGRQGALCGNINIAKGKFYATEHAVVVDHFGVSDVLWSAYFLDALNLNQYATATAQPGLAVSKIVNVLIPLPPLTEQKRIVQKLEQILLLCEG